MAGGVARGTDWLAPLGHNGRVYVVPRFRLVYVMVAKNACTALKWLVAELAGEDVDSFQSGLNAYTADEHAVHDRSQFKYALYPDEVDPVLRSEIHPENGWFIFGVVRDPRMRLFSAWQDKLLMQDPLFRSLRDEPWYPRVPEDAQAVTEDFAGFVELMSSQPDFRLRNEGHFRPQSEALVWGRIPYTRIYPIEQLDELRADLAHHLAQFGWAQPVQFRRSNETPLRANAMAFPPRVRAQVEALYAADFEEWGQLWDFGQIARAPEWSPAEIREIQVRARLGRRLGDVRQLALDNRNDARKAAQRAERASARADRADQRAAKLARELVTVRRRSESIVMQQQASARRPSARAARFARRVRRRVMARTSTVARWLHRLFTQP